MTIISVLSVLFWLMFGFGVYLDQDRCDQNIPSLIVCLATWPIMLGMGMSSKYIHIKE